MRNALGLMLAVIVAAVAITGVWYYVSARAVIAAPQTTAARIPDPAAASAKPAAKDDVEFTAAVPATPAAAASLAKSACANPDALGISRTVVVDTTGGPGFGLDHFKQFDFLGDHEVVLTFDDGPWPTNTPAVLKALADECTTGVFFPIGKHATYYPEILKPGRWRRVTPSGAHTWSHAALTNKKLNEQSTPRMRLKRDSSAVKVGAWVQSPAPFFRFPAASTSARNRPSTYLGTRNVAIFSCDLDSFDFKAQQGRRKDHRDGDDRTRQARQGHHPDA